MVSSVQIPLKKESKENGSETQTTWKVEVRSRRKKWGPNRGKKSKTGQDWPPCPSSYKYRR